MSDHYDITLERKLESRVTGARRIELITGIERRRRWCRDDKERIVVESFAPGANVSEVARRNGLSPQQLFAWRRAARALFGTGGDGAIAVSVPRSKARRARPSAVNDHAPAFAPVIIADNRDLPRNSSGAAPPPLATTTIEIVIGDAVVRVAGQVETAALVAVLRAVRRAS